LQWASHWNGQACSETMLTGESQFHISTPWGSNLDPSLRETIWWTTGPVELCMNAMRLLALHRAPLSSRLCQLWSRKEDLKRVWNRDRRAAWDQVGLSHCWHDGLVTVRDEARLRQGHNDQSRRGHQCSETMITGESRFHLKGQSNEIFYLQFFHWWIPLKPLTRYLMTFRIWLRIRWDIRDFWLTLRCNL
jgi:hypothetical protein